MNYKKDGLTTKEVKEQQEKHGKNEFVKAKKESFLKKIIEVIFEPMFLLLLIAAIIYFILGQPTDGIVMLIFVVGIIGIDVFQEWKTDKTLNALKNLSAPKVFVIRNGIKQEINSSELVPGDLILIYEGVKIPADGYIVKNNDISIDESTLTGESEPVWKSIYNGKEDNEYWKKYYCYAGTLVIQGSATVLIDKIGIETEYGKIGKNIIETVKTKTPLQKQIDNLVKTCAIVAFILFVLVGIFTYLNIPDHSFKDRIIESLLSGVTLAMALIPEEFPVVLTVFLSMGAWRLAKKNSLVKKLPSVETLGAISVLCVDKTGTITMNKMHLESIWTNDVSDYELCEIMGKCCEEEAYDPMEKAMYEKCFELGITKEQLFKNKKIKEYPFSNETKIMGRVLEENGKYNLYAKGSYESIIDLCDIDKNLILGQMEIMSKQGLRVIAIAQRKITEIKENLKDYKLDLVGLVGLIDPPRKDIDKNIEKCNKAGIKVIMITGDNGITAASIANKIGFKNIKCITGEEIDKMDDSELKEKVKDTNIFSRVIPEHKMRIVKAFKDNGEIVAMTGDGVNDAPALKYSDIGIAMGKKGSEVSKEAADLILLDDNFSTIVETIEDGRRIYDNIKKAIEYILIIHIPIALSSLLAPLLNISPDNLFLLPFHIVLLELIIDPTCSIVFERQPAEDNIMTKKPRNPFENILSSKGLIKSSIQGLVMFLGSFLTYYYILNNYNSQLARSMGLIIIMISNLFLVQVNSSKDDYVFISMKKLIKDKIMWFTNFGTILGILIILYTSLNKFLKLSPLNIKEFLVVIVISFISVYWYELVKVIKKVKVSKKVKFDK